MRLRILSAARGRWLLASGLCALVALIAAVTNAEGVQLLPPTLKTHSLGIAGASTQAFVDVPSGTILKSAEPQAFDDLTSHALLLGELMSAPPVLAEIAEQAGIAPSKLSGATSYVDNVPENFLWPDLEERANQIIAARAPYQLDIEPDPALPRFEIYARAPTIQDADRLADAAVPGINAFLRANAVRNGADPSTQFRVEQLGPARGGVINTHATAYILGLTFVIVFGLCMALLALAARVRRGWKLAALRPRSAQLLHDPQPATRANGTPSEGLPHRRPAPDSHAAGAPGAIFGLPTNMRTAFRRDALRLWTSGRRSATRTATSRVVADSDDWPHTNRVLPWMIAGFLFMLWLVPFDVIQYGSGSLPINLTLDRIVLPFIVVTWVFAVASGGRRSPRLRLTWVHAGVFTFAGFACLSLIVAAHYLNQTLLLDQGVKRLALLVAFVTFFVVVASVVRRSEVPTFLRYTLILAVIAAIGTIVEYRFKYNVFYDLAQRFLPGFQSVQAQTQSVGIDDIGLVRGPADAPLEAVAMFTMALPIALIGITDAVRRRSRLLYGLAAALLLAAAFATGTRSGLLGPLAVVLTVAYFKRRQMIRLAPLAVVLVGVVKVVAPGAIGGVVTQLEPSQLGVSTVTDRVLRYDAIRPDVWLHLVFGQGFGTYTIRVLDNEFLGRLIEGGVLGLTAYVLMFLSVVFVAIGPIRRREPVASTIGLVAASAAVGTLVLSATYDWLGFAHGPYIFFSLAGLLVAAVKSPMPAVSPKLVELPRAKSPPTLEEAWSS